MDKRKRITQAERARIDRANRDAWDDYEWVAGPRSTRRRRDRQCLTVPCCAGRTVTIRPRQIGDQLHETYGTRLLFMCASCGAEVTPHQRGRVQHTLRVVLYRLCHYPKEYSVGDVVIGILPK